MRKSVAMVLLSVFLFGKTVELEPIKVTATPQKKRMYGSTYHVRAIGLQKSLIVPKCCLKIRIA